jgi:hypothetical protein
MRKVLFFFSTFLFIVPHLHAVTANEEYKYLDGLALQAGADKGSSFHNYTEIYAKYFAPLKERPIKFLEIGIYQGSSVKLWESYFQQADLHFIDITLGAAQYFSKRSHYHIANQENSSDLENFLRETGGNFDVILDDGGHTMNMQIVSFQVLFPHLKSGGMYIIEDLHTSYWPSFGGGAVRGTTISFLKDLIDDLNFVGNRTTRASHRNLTPSILNSLSLYQREIESIHFYDSVAIIIKR